ncbi:hypothetical protein NW762_009482 [Fusarium torreyae]|uniref:Uncharacterized protein n=1 Tax=Fusarium torreyae TaxID=1237075 RepID=A0A9W8RVE4_9HYPO|nr:hypothetical protein NW762_009482 [Fusarium torreyae]
MATEHMCIECDNSDTAPWASQRSVSQNDRVNKAKEYPTHSRASSTSTLSLDHQSTQRVGPLLPQGGLYPRSGNEGQQAQSRQNTPIIPNKSPTNSSAKTSNSSSPKKSPKRKKNVEEDDDDNENGDSVNQRDKCRRVSGSAISTSLSFGDNSKVIFEFKDACGQLSGDQYMQFDESMDYEKAKSDCLFDRDALERTHIKKTQH